MSLGHEVNIPDSTPVTRLTMLLNPRLMTHDLMVSGPKVPLAPYGQNSDPAAAWANFRTDLRAVLKALEILSAGPAT